jgi:Ca2+-binding EF-hand superfamily protein
MGCFKSKSLKEGEEPAKVFPEQAKMMLEENKLYKEIDQLFHEFERNNDRTLDREEFTDAIKEFHKRNLNNKELRERVEMFIDQMVIDKKKIFTKDEFRIIMSSIVFEEFTINELIDLFKTFDKKKDGVIDKQEIMYVFKNLGLEILDETAAEMIMEAKLNKSHTIDFEEFARAILAK